MAAEKIRSIIEEFPFENEETQPAGRVTVSMGVATYPTDATDGDQLIRCADRRLYTAKENGRNQVCSAEMVVSRIEE